MPVSKVRKNKKIMKPRTFSTVKSARRYAKRNMAQFLITHRNNNELIDTMKNALSIANTGLEYK